MVRLPISVLSTEFVATNIFARVQRAEFVCLIQSANVLRTNENAGVPDELTVNSPPQQRADIRESVTSDVCWGVVL